MAPPAGAVGAAGGRGISHGDRQRQSPPHWQSPAGAGAANGPLDVAPGCGGGPQCRRRPSGRGLGPGVAQSSL